MQEASGSLRAQTGGRYSGPHGSCALVNWDVIRSISMMSDVSTRSKLCFLRRDWRADLQNLLFSHIEIALTSQLDAFLRCVEDSETTPRLRTLLSNVKSFTYHPIIVCSSTGCFTGVQDLWKISNIPLRAKDGTVLFPRLVMSRLSLSVLRGDGSPQLRDLVGYDRTSRVNRGRFLKNVTILCLDSISADDSGSIAQIFGFFGMDIVRTVKFSMAGAPHSSTFPWILKKQRLLQTMILDDRGSMALQRYCEPDDIQGTKGYAQYLSLTIGAIWKNRDCWPELEEVVLRLGQENLQEVLTELRLQILQVSIFQLVEKAWLGKMLFWQIGNGTKTPLSI